LLCRQSHSDSAHCVGLKENRDDRMSFFAVSKNRNQHFVPKHYLRRFSFDDGKRIRLLNLNSGKYVDEAPLKNQCSADHFYTENLAAEQMLTEIEGVAEDMFRKICDTEVVPEYLGGEHQDLMSVLSLMHFRTRRQAEGHSDLIELIAKRHLRMSDDPRAKEAVPFLNEVRIQDRSAAVRLALKALETAQIIFDLRLRLIIAPEGMSFITSDHPVVLLNQAFFTVLQHPRILGLAASGLQIFLPISPRFLLIAFDPKIYRVGNRKQSTYQLERRNDCDLINALQIVNAEENVYFYDQDLLSGIRVLLTKLFSSREQAVASGRPLELPIPDKPGGVFFRR